VKNWGLKPNNMSAADNQQLQSSSTSRMNNQIEKQQLGNNNNNNNMTNKPSSAQNSQITLTNYEMSQRSSSSSLSSSFLTQTPLNTQPLITIKGTASIKHYHILNDKRFIVTKDSDENVCVWDVLQARKSESLGKENYEQAIKVLNGILQISIKNCNQNNKIINLKSKSGFNNFLFTHTNKKRFVKGLLAFQIGSRLTSS
jgi:hypothetical protein